MAIGSALCQYRLLCRELHILDNWATSNLLKISTFPWDWLRFAKAPSWEIPSSASCLVTEFPKSELPKSVIKVFIGGSIDRKFLSAVLMDWLFTFLSGYASPYPVNLSTSVKQYWYARLDLGRCKMSATHTFPGWQSYSYCLDAPFIAIFFLNLFRLQCKQLRVIAFASWWIPLQ